MHFRISRYYIFEQFRFASIFINFNKTKKLTDLKFCQSVVNRLTDTENENSIKSRLYFVEHKDQWKSKF